MSTHMDVAMYARLSQEDADAQEGEATATQRQIADCRARAEREGWRVVAVYEDPDHSASNPRRRRPEFDRMLADLGDGVHVGAVLCFKLDRLLRQPKEAEAIIKLADSAGFGIVSLSDPGLDLSTPTGRAMFRQTMTWAKLETETMSLRIRRKARAMAEEGRPNGGIRSFGLEPYDKAAGPPRLRPAEAQLVREAAERVLAGESLHSMVVDWNLRGVRTPGRRVAPEGRRWEVSSLKRMLLAPRMVGDRVHHGVVAGTGVIPPILEREVWERLRAVLAVPRGGRAGGSIRRHYLTGLVRCGRCGAKLVARPDYRGTTRYVCARPRGCGGLTVAKRNMEPLLTEAIAQRLDSPEFAAALARRRKGTKPSTDVVQLRADQAALEEAASAYFVDRVITKAEFARVRAALEKRIDEAQRRLERSTTQDGMHRLAGMDLRAEWAQRPALWQYEVARTLIDRITVNPAPRRGTRFDPSRMDVDWRA